MHENPIKIDLKSKYCLADAIKLIMLNVVEKNCFIYKLCMYYKNIAVKRKRAKN